MDSFYFHFHRNYGSFRRIHPWPFFVGEIIGPRQIAQLTFYDYVVGITIGSIAATVAIDETMPLWIGI